MNKLLLIFWMAVSLISCTAVKFEAPQPAGAAALTEFPKKTLGTFTSGEQDTLRISRSSFSYTNGNEEGLNADLSAGNTVLKKLKNTYILNLKDNGHWEVFPVKLARNKIIVHYADLDGKTKQLLDLKNSASVKEITTIDGKLDHYLANPSATEFEQLLKKKLFSEKVIFRRIK